MKRLVPLLLLVLLAVPACAANPGDGSEPARRGSRNVILEDEIRASHATDLLRLIRQARPHWFGRDSRSSTESNTVTVVYLNGVRFGLEDSLEQIDPEGVTRIEYLDGREATFRFGQGHGSGAVLVTQSGAG